MAVILRGCFWLCILLIPLILVRLLPVSFVICCANHKRYHMSQAMKWNGVELGNPFVPVFPLGTPGSLCL